ncbi:MAG TPA: ABC transporter permease [Gemmatimonadales bacterium]|nr:ABC transporter permease [Gemmatimonadales bacterium]
MRDVRLALRTLRRTPSYTLTVMLTLALGIGGTTAVASVFRSVIVRPLPYAPADRVMLLAERDSAAAIRLPSYPTFLDWRRGTDAFEAMAFARGLGTVLTSAGGAERLVGAFVSDEYFRVLPEVPALGRLLGPADFAPGAPPAVLLSWHLWRQSFGSDRAVLGRSVTLGERAYTVVGVLPAGFVYPTWADLYAPIAAIQSTDAALGQRGVHVDSRTVGRLRAGVDSAAGQAALTAVAAHLADAYPAENGGWRGAALVPVASEILGDSGGQLRLLTAGAVLVLLIACVNVAGLALARAGARSRELAIRAALGGGRPALLRLLAAECLVLGAAAGVAGLGIAVALLAVIRVAGRDLLPRVDEVVLDPAILLAATALAVLVIVALGLLPAMRRAGPLTAALREGAGGGRGPARRRLRAALVVAEIALALVLLTGAGLLVRSFERLVRVPSGLDDARLLAVPIDPPLPRYEAAERALQLYRDVAAAVAAVPGVRSVALTNHVPLSGGSTNTALEVDGRPARADETDQALFREVDSAYFRTAGIPILRGRDFTPDEIARPGDAVLVNQALAGRYWPGGDPIGRRITVYKSAQGRPDFGQPIRATIVGVAGNVRHFSLDTDFEPEVYLPYTATVWPRMALLVRTDGDPARVAGPVTRAVRGVEPALPLEGAQLTNRVYGLSDSLRESLAYRRFVTGLLAAFAIPAVLLAALGIYGVVVYLVAQRTREMGIRMALGAQRRDVLRLVLGEGLRLAAAGVGLGAMGAALTTRWLESELYETSATDPATFLAAAAALTAVAALATFVPARRATTIDPSRALQAE